MHALVIPCSQAKVDVPAPARLLYRGAQFRDSLRAAETVAARTRQTVLVLSARHGLVRLGTVLSPYEQRMDKPRAVGPDVLRAQAAALRVRSVDALLPALYLRALTAALDVPVRSLYPQGADVLGQRRVLGLLRHGA